MMGATRREWWAMALAGVTRARGAEPPVRIGLLTGASDVPFHDWRRSSAALARVLAASGRVHVAQVFEQPSILTPESLAGLDALLANYCGPRWGAEAERAVWDFVAAGGGFASLHMFSYSFSGFERAGVRWVKAGPESRWPQAEILVGASWSAQGIEGAHGRRQAVEVMIVDRDHPVTQGLGESFLTFDEVPAGLKLGASSHRLAVAGRANSTPALAVVAWVAPCGKGRIFHTTLGHDVQAIETPGFARLLTQGVCWTAASGRPVAVSRAPGR